MTWRQRQLNTFLGTILLILVAAVVVVLGLRYRENLAKPEENEAIDPVSGTVIDQSVYTALAYQTDDFSLSFSKDDADAWHWDGDPEFPLDDTTVTQILDALIAWNPQQTLTDAEALEASQISRSTRSLTATTADGASTTLVFGKATTDGNSHYVQLNGDETTVYITDNTLYDLLDIPVYDMCRLPELPALQENTILSVAIGRPAEDDGQLAPFTVLTSQRAEDGTETTTWRSNGANVTDDPSVKALVADLTALTISKCIDYNPSAEAVSICGLDAPTADLTVTYASDDGAEKALYLVVGNRLPDGSGRYVRLAESTTIYFLPTELLDPLMRLSAEGLEG